jgi:hypothetical protein
VVLFDLKSSILREVSACPRGTKTVLFRLAKFLLEALFACTVLFLKIVEYTPIKSKNKNKTSMANAMEIQRFTDLFLVLRVPDRCTGEPPSHSQS